MRSLHEKGEPLMMGSTNFCHSQEGWISKIHFILSRTEQKDIKETMSCPKHCTFSSRNKINKYPLLALE